MQKQQNDWPSRIRATRRVVIKLGTSVVTGDEGEINPQHLESLARSIAQLKSVGRQVVLVSSGAVGLGRGRLGLHRARLDDLAMRQACAAVGQSLLMHAYEMLFRTYDIRLAQLLLTEEDFVDRRRYSNLRRTIEKLLKLGVLPVVNENDTVSTAELEYVAVGSGRRVFSDNDRLAALVMSKLEADALILLTNVDGLMRQRPPGAADETGPVIPLVEEISAELKRLGSGPSAGGRGGMLTKLEAAEIAMRAGGVAVIANGKRPDILDRIFAGEETGTAFMSRTRMAGKRRWIAYAAGVRGRMIVNRGAHAAIIAGKASLLSTGVVRVEEKFESMDVVSIVDDEGREFARGISDYASQEAAELIRRGTEVSADKRTGAKARVLVKRDNIVLLDNR